MFWTDLNSTLCHLEKDLPYNGSMSKSEDGSDCSNWTEGSYNFTNIKEPIVFVTEEGMWKLFLCDSAYQTSNFVFTAF